MSAWRIIVSLVSVIGIIIWSIWIIRNKERWRIAVAPITYFAHVLVFYFCATYLSLPIDFINGWSNAVRIHAGIIFIGVGLINLGCRSSLWTGQS